MRSFAERRAYKRAKYVLKQFHAELKYKHGIYTIKWSQSEGPRLLLDLYNYTITSTNLADALKSYNEIKEKQRFL